MFDRANLYRRRLTATSLQESTDLDDLITEKNFQIDMLLYDESARARYQDKMKQKETA